MINFSTVTHFNLNKKQIGDDMPGPGTYEQRSFLDDANKTGGSSSFQKPFHKADKFVKQAELKPAPGPPIFGFTIIVVCICITVFVVEFESSFAKEVLCLFFLL